MGNHSAHQVATDQSSFSAHFSSLVPNDVWTSIFACLSPRELKSVACVSKKFLRLANANLLWRNHFVARDAFAAAKLETKGFSVVWKRAYYEYTNALDPEMCTGEVRSLIQADMRTVNTAGSTLEDPHISYPLLPLNTWWQARKPRSTSRLIGYYEIKVLESKGRKTITMGVSTKFPQKHWQVGWPLDGEGEAIGYHGDDGLLYHSAASTRQKLGIYAKGDVIGCGVDFRKGMVFFVKNGKLVTHKKFQEISPLSTTTSESAKPNARQIYPVVCCRPVQTAHFEINYGPEFSCNPHELTKNVVFL